MSSFDPTGTFYKILPEVYREQVADLACLTDSDFTKRVTEVLGFDPGDDMTFEEVVGRVTARLTHITSQAIVSECQRIEREAEAKPANAKRTGKRAA